MSNPNALVVMPNVVRSTGIEAVLKQIEVDVIATPDGMSAIERFLLDKVEIVIIDCDLPAMSGLECACTIRALEYGTDTRIPIIGFVLERTKDLEKKCFQKGVDVLIEKNCTLAQLQNTVREWLQPSGCTDC